MKKLYKKINEIWLKFKTWSESNLIGYLIGGIFKIILIVIIFSVIFHFTIGPFKAKPVVGAPVADSSDTTSNNNCSVTGINLHGQLYTYIPKHNDNDTSFNYDVVSSENVIESIKEANDDEKIKAIVVEVDSPGGSPVAALEISNAIKSSSKPVVAFIRETGASAAYWSISSAGKIFASENSNVGSIGVTSSYVSNAIKNEKDGYTYNQLSIGKFKDAGSFNKPLTEEERAIFR